MDAREQLRRYLEQRRELGESDLILDAMSVDEVMGVIAGLRRAPRPVVTRDVARAEPPVPRTAPPRPVAPPPVAPAPAPVVHPPEATIAETAIATHKTEETDVTKKAPPGLVVGTANGTLFTENPFAHVKSLSGIAKLVEACTRCDLYKTATHGVPGEGNLKAELVCVGEAPGANEDATGRPFVGAAGQLLTKILGAVQLQREDVFICNVLKHRPPGNRNPKPDEVQACSPYLVRQIELISPKVILAFGTFAAQTLLETKLPIGKLRGAVHRYYGVPLIVTYHPAALLRNPAWKRPTWEDVQLARRILDHGA